MDNEIKALLDQAESAAAELCDEKSASNIGLLKKALTYDGVDPLNYLREIAAASESEIFRAGVLAGLDNLAVRKKSIH